MVDLTSTLSGMPRRDPSTTLRHAFVLGAKFRDEKEWVKVL